MENSAKLHDDMKNLGVETTETLQDEMNGLNNKNNDNPKLNEEMNKETSKSNSPKLQEEMSKDANRNTIPNLQEEMKGTDNIKNDNSSLQDEMKSGSLNNDLRSQVNNSPNENLQSEISGKEELSSGGKLNDEMNRNANSNINPVNESMKNRESSNVNNDGNNGASQRSFRQVDTKENFATRKSREIKQAYKLGQSATERFNIPKNYKNLANISKNLSVPLIVKEVGFGMSKEVGQKLLDIGVKYIDVAGKGGTNFIEIEDMRIFDKDYSEFYSWGIPTAKSILDVRSLSDDFFLISSGGIRNASDVCKSIIIGADMCAISGEVLSFLLRGDYDYALKYLKELQTKIKIFMALVGVKNIKELKNVPYKLTGRLKELVED
ncbi:MAG: alpha-hydroxy-acid oxidizing protein [Anaerococcus sp.]|nr:alpha-hydroxy-acid oxidizing protein [Anaerococcus sp.]